MKRLILWWLATCTAAAVTGQPKQALTFDQALEMTMTRNPELEAISYEKETAEKERKAAYGLRLPKASVTGAYIYMGDDMAIDMNDLKAPVGGVLEGLGNLPNIPPAILQQASSLLAKDWSMKLQDRSFANVGANITLPLYTGGKINAANNAAKIKIEEVAEKGNQTRGSLVSELTERYYGLVLALQVVEVRRQVLEGMQHHLSDAKALEANGIIAKGERLYAEVHTAEAERELLKAQKTVETLYSALSNTLGGDESTYIPATSMFILSDIENVSYFKDLAKQHSPLLKQVGYKKQLATENMRLQRADFAPQVALTGMAAFYNYQVSPIIPKWAVGAGVSLKIFDGLNREYKFSAAKSQIRQVEAVGHQAESDILTRIDKLYSEMVTYSQQLPSVNASGRFAEEYLRIKEEAFKEGAAPSSDVVDARLNLAKIRIERLQAAYYYDMILARLLEACGQSELFPDYGKRAAAMPIRYEHDF